MATDMTAVAGRVFLTASYVLVGYLLQRFGALRREDGEVMLRFVVNVTLPAMLVHTLTASNLLFGPGVPLVWLTAVFATLVVAGGGSLVYNRTPSYEKGLLTGALCGSNLGTFAYPFVEAVWGVEGLRLAALYDVPNAAVVFGLGAYVFAKEQRNALADVRGAAARHDDGGVYHGEWSVTGESKQGVGVYEYPSGATYEGQWNNNQKAGFGVYKFAKGGSYAGGFKRGKFDGMGLRFMRNGGVKSGKFTDGDFVEALSIERTDDASTAATEMAKKARNAADKSKITESNAQFVSRVVWKTATFPPFAAMVVAFIIGSSGSALPGYLNSLINPLAQANRPLVLLTLGVLFQPFMPKLRARVVSHFLCTKYAMALLAAAAIALVVPISEATQSLRFILPALALMPVPSVVVQYALEHEGDAALAGCIVNYSQVVSLLFLLLIGGASQSVWLLQQARWVWPAILLSAGALVLGISVVADRAFAPTRMVFKPKTGEAGRGKDAKDLMEISLAPPDDGAGPTTGPAASSAAAKRGEKSFGGYRNKRPTRLGINSLVPSRRFALLRASASRWPRAFGLTNAVRWGETKGRSSFVSALATAQIRARTVVLAK